MDVRAVRENTKKIETQLVNVVASLIGWRCAGEHVTEARARKRCRVEDAVTCVGNAVVKLTVNVTRDEQLNLMLSYEIE